MKKVLLIAFLSSVLVIALSQEAYGQRSSKRSSTDEYFDESGGFQHRLWYGSHVTLGFQGNSFQSTFQAGLAPMIGYKVFDALSIGPATNCGKKLTNEAKEIKSLVGLSFP